MLATIASKTSSVKAVQYFINTDRSVSATMMRKKEVHSPDAPAHTTTTKWRTHDETAAEAFKNK